MSRLSTLAAFLVLMSPALVPAADLAPAPRVIHPRFNLEYLPRVDGQGVIGIRPAEIARYATKTEVELGSALVFGTFSQLMGGKELDAVAWPTFADLEQCVCCLDLRITAPPGPGEQGSFMIGGKTPALLRTVRPFDWDRVLRKSFPNATPARHAGRSYLQMWMSLPLPLALISAFGEPMAAYVLDDRTLVVGTQSDIHALLDRLAEGKSPPKPLPGWTEVDRDLIAFALDNREVPLVSGHFPAKYPLGKEIEVLAGSLRTLAVGLSTSENRTRVRFVATARNATRAKSVSETLTRFFRQAAEIAEDAKEPEQLELFGLALLKSTAIERDGRNVTATLSADGNVVKMIFTLLRGPA